VSDAGLLQPGKGRDGNGAESLFPAIIGEVSAVRSRVGRKGSPDWPSSHLSLLPQRLAQPYHRQSGQWATAVGPHPAWCSRQSL